MFLASEGRHLLDEDVHDHLQEAIHVTVLDGLDRVDDRRAMMVVVELLHRPEIMHEVMQRVHEYIIEEDSSRHLDGKVRERDRLLRHSRVWVDLVVQEYAYEVRRKRIEPL